ncbi:N-acetylmuramoyl-L-alanine amidase [Hyphomonas oceanitis]|uniref:N-acetylmuramoyl-L-alanine amidase n=1 Tax=Hyphomonas oceanitis SCH89 TaxID=1280953 RepID=A0A059GC04_9PROT|nr:N-acetylmuramoyl-L-alanine amidase [Hyphomonas oceanitis]KDA04003.1 N-acetylmuramoyl-L-alanine amidase [Hyphomonas oceanitis SCH89]
MQVEQVPSPNFNDRKHAVDMLVLHYTGMESGEAALARMCDPAAEVSAHYMVWEEGRITQLVAEDRRAWHAGVSVWQGDTDLNSRSIGIEIVNGGHDVPLSDGTLPPYPDAQIAAVIALCKGILSRHDIPASRVVAHSDIAPARKTDPGEHFPWAQLAAEGIGLWPSSAPLSLDESSLMPGDSGPAVSDLQNMLCTIGYGLEATGTYDETTRLVISAFQRRYVPAQITGAADPETLERIANVYGLFAGAA